MLFNSLQFVGFFLSFLCVYHALPWPGAKRLFIALASILFYATYSYRFIPFLLCVGMLDFSIARLIQKSADASKRKTLLAISVTVNLLVLAVFKYTNFALENV